MRIALILEAPYTSGGGFQQFLALAHDLRPLGHDLVVLAPSSTNLETLRSIDIPCYTYRFGLLRKLFARATVRSQTIRRVISALPRWLRRLCGPLDIDLDAHGISLTIFFHSSLPLLVHNSPYMAVVYDLCHRDHPEFPEVSEQFEARERIFHATLSRAVGVIVSSHTLASEVSRLYGVDKQRVLLLPLVPALHSRKMPLPETVRLIRDKYGLVDDYVFYPAQFWPHKNHVYLLEAIKALEISHGLMIHAAFAGTDYGNRSFIQSVADRLQLSWRIHFLGFVPNEDMSALYGGARAMVMPTYFGPTNMPPLEAITIGCPVIYSDRPEFREQFRDAALYCDLLDPASLALQLKTILTQPNVVDGLRLAGFELLGRTDWDNRIKELREALSRFDYTRRRWSQANPELQCV